jgi:hypothetical protein
MRTKALFVAAAIGLASVIPSLAQVYSVNVVGYVNVDVPSGFSLIANPLDAADNNADALIPAVDGITVYDFKADGSGYAIRSYLNPILGWQGDAVEMTPGKGVWVFNPGDALTITFVGEITEGEKVNDIPQGFSIRASIVPQSGALATDLGFPAAENDTVYEFDNVSGGYVISSLLPIVGWQPSEPSIDVGQSFFVNAGAATTWTRDFTVGN